MITHSRNSEVRRTREGFTLIETLLATSLFMLLVGAAIISLEPSSRGSELDQGAVRLESLLRFARAEAANTGRRVRVSFVSNSKETTVPSNQIRVAWEPEPLAEPEVFQELSCAKWELSGCDDGVNVEQVRLMDSDNLAPAGGLSESELEDEDALTTPSSEPAPITFNPDGSSDSAEIVLAARSADDSRRVTVRVMGLTGVISREVTTDTKGEPESDGHGRTQDSSPISAAE
ncbi:MAG: GspH/FimT family pseudopilin [Verrucomicrobia bacterium]|nr:GspH/FimT family pseudopilin [Verrucomicrobiota bacterium]